MAQLSEDVMLWLGLVDQLDFLAVALVALTARAIHETAANLSLLQWRALVELDASEPLRLHDLALRLPTSMPGTSRLVKRMAERSLVITHPVPGDGRGVSVELSPQGRALHAAVIERRRRLIVDGLGRRPTTSDLDTGLAVLGDRLRAKSLASVSS